MSVAMPGTESREDVIAQVMKAGKAADLFDPDAEKAKATYRRWSRILHPDVNPGDDEAAAAFSRLNQLYDSYKRPAPDVIHGDLADLFFTPEGLLKITRSHRDNDLMAREALALRKLAKADPDLLPFYPALLSTQRQRDPATRVIRQANLLAPLEGWHTLTEVHEAYPDGIHPRAAAWMWRRLLTALGGAHQQGIIHGAVLPGNIMIHAGQHGLVLLDWCYSAVEDQKIPAIVKDYRDWYPHEVLNKRTPRPCTDIHLAARTMEFLLGRRIFPQFQGFVNGCTLYSRRSRPNDAWALLQELDELLERIFGPPRFHQFTMPPKA